MRNRCCASLLLLLLLSPLLLTPPAGDAAACDKDPQCGGGMCCAVSIWVKSIRICTPMGKVGDSCHPLTRKVKPFWKWEAGKKKQEEKKKENRGSIFGAENASHVSMYAWLSLFTGFIQPICLFSPKVITLK
ncbi:prokineticin-2 isoform 2-T2 [Glossophaga mutica]